MTQTTQTTQTTQMADMTRPADNMLQRTDAWSRGAQQVREQATRLGLTLDEAELALRDVRDLQALQASLSGRGAGSAWTRWTALLGQGARVRARVMGAGAPLVRLAQ
jgi:hypothetical protein